MDWRAENPAAILYATSRFFFGMSVVGHDMDPNRIPNKDIFSKDIYNALFAAIT